MYSLTVPKVRNVKYISQSKSRYLEDILRRISEISFLASSTSDVPRLVSASLPTFKTSTCKALFSVFTWLSTLCLHMAFCSVCIKPLSASLL